MISDEEFAARKAAWVATTAKSNKRAFIQVCKNSYQSAAEGCVTDEMPYRGDGKRRNALIC